MTVPAPPPGDEWVGEAVKAVEASITKLMDEFRAQPFIHRVEHSLHVRLMQLLSEWEHLRGLVSDRRQRFQDAADPQRVARDQAAEEEARADRRQAQGFLRRGCSRSQPARKSNPRAVHRWYIDAPIVIELGLGYWTDHLSGDREKLTNSRVQHQYLVHLSRMPSGYRRDGSHHRWHRGAGPDRLRSPRSRTEEGVLQASGKPRNYADRALAQVGDGGAACHRNARSCRDEIGVVEGTASAGGLASTITGHGRAQFGVGWRRGCPGQCPRAAA